MNATSSGTLDSTQAASAEQKVDLDHVFNPPTRDEWLAQAIAGLPNHDSLDTLASHTLDNLSIGVLYDSAPENAYTHLGQNCAASGSWDNRLSVTCTNDSESNKKIIEGLENGNASLELHVNQHTNLNDLLNGVMLDILPISFRAGDHATAIAEQLHHLLKSESVNTTSTRVSFNVDPIGDWLNGYTDSVPQQDHFNAMADFAIEQSQLLPKAQTTLVDMAVHHNAGASSVQELTAGLMSATLYLESLLARGMSLDNASQSISFQFACDADVLMGVVKLRSFCNLWRHLLTEFAKVHGTSISNDCLQPRIVVETSRRYLSTIDHWNNHLRNIASCSAAALGSAQTVLVHPHDQIGDWNAESDTSLGERIARNLPIILDRECGLTNVTDPMAGSYAIDTLTEQLSSATWEALSHFENADSWLQGAINGKWQTTLNDTHERRMTQLRDSEHIMVGVNRYQPTDDNDDVTSNKSTSSSTAKLKPVRDAEAFEGAAL